MYGFSDGAGVMKTVNPHKHAFPHAKLYNVQLTSIKRLAKYSEKLSRHMIEDEDIRNYSISRAGEYAAWLKKQEWQS
jgi:hypothetical protein